MSEDIFIHIPFNVYSASAVSAARRYVSLIEAQLSQAYTDERSEAQGNAGAGSSAGRRHGRPVTLLSNSTLCYAAPVTLLSMGSMRRLKPLGLRLRWSPSETRSSPKRCQDSQP